MRRNARIAQRFGLKRKALVIFLLLVILPTLGVGVIVQIQFNQILSKQFQDTTIRNLDSVVSQLEEQTSTVEDIANYMILSPDLNEYLRPSPPLSNERSENLKRAIENMLTFHLFSKKYIRSFSIYGFNGHHIDMGEPVIADEGKWLGIASRRKGGIVWTDGYAVQSGWNGSFRVVSLVRTLNAFSQITRPQANLVIRLDEESIVRLLEKGLYKESGRIFVIGSDGQQVLGSEQAMPEGFDPNDVLEAFANGNERFMRYTIENDTYMAFYRPMENTGWNILAMIPQSLVNQETADVRNVMAVILAAILLLGISALVGFQYTIIRPILRLKNEANRVRLGDFTARVPVESNDEISELNRKFNEMVLTIQELIEHKYKLELRERESELRLLQNQMDPHFLYNTLDMIRWTARLEKAGKTSQLIEMLSRFFRSALNKGHYVTTVRQELEFVQSYLYLQERRLGRTFRYSIFVDHAIAEAPMLKTTIQPLVENFVKHGLNKNKEHNAISVKSYAVADEIWIDVQDNGRGIEPGQLAAIRSKLRSGHADDAKAGALSNIQERLSIYFGEGYGLEIVSSTPSGTLIRLKIPNRMKDGGETDEDGNGRT